jgi:hypothetical protein
MTNDESIVVVRRSTLIRIGIGLLVSSAILLGGCGGNSLTLPAVQSGYMRLAVAGGTSTTAGQVTLNKKALLICWAVSGSPASLDYQIGQPFGGPTVLYQATQSRNREGCQYDPGNDNGAEEVVFTLGGSGSFVASVDQQGVMLGTSNKADIPSNGLKLTAAGDRAATIYTDEQSIDSAAQGVSTAQQTLANAVEQLNNDESSYGDDISSVQDDFQSVQDDYQSLQDDASTPNTGLCQDVAGFRQDVSAFTSQDIPGATGTQAKQVASDEQAVQNDAQALSPAMQTFQRASSNLPGYESPDSPSNFSQSANAATSALSAAHSADSQSQTTLQNLESSANGLLTQAESNYCSS